MGEKNTKVKMHSRLEDDTESIFPKRWSMLEQNMLLESGWGPRPQETGMAGLDS